MKKGNKYECVNGAVLELLSYFWPEKYWYVGYKGKVYARDHDDLKTKIQTGKLKLIQ